MLRIEEQQSESRVREVFDLIDVSGDGVIQLEEFQRAARCLINDECEVTDSPCAVEWGEEEVDQTGLVPAAQIEALFNSADVDRSEATRTPRTRRTPPQRVLQRRERRD